MKISVIYADNLMQLRCVDEKEIFIVSPSTIGNSFLLHMLGNMVVGDTNAIAVVDGGLFKEYVTIRHRTHPGEPMVVTVRFNGAILHNLTTEEVAKHYPYVRESKVPPDSAVPVPGIRGYPDPYLRNKDFEGYGSVVQDYLETTHTALSLSDIFEEIADRIAMVQTAVKRGVYPDAPTPEEGNLIPLGRIEIPSMVAGTGDSPMLARFECVNTYGPYPLTVKFTDTSVGDRIEVWKIDFDDGETLMRNAKGEGEYSHTYELPGVYKPSLYIAGRTKAGFEVESDFLFPAEIEVGETELDGDEQY